MRGPVARRAREVAAGTDILITMLPGFREEREVMAGPSGVLAVMPSTVWVDMASSSPAAGRELAAAAQARGVGVLDAPGWDATGISRRRCGSLGQVPTCAGSARRPAAHHPRRRQRLGRSFRRGPPARPPRRNRFTGFVFKSPSDTTLSCIARAS